MALKKKIAIGMAGAMAAFVGVFVFLTVWDHMEDRKYGDGMERKLKRIAGSTAVDCGTVSVGEAPQTASQCAMDAFSSHKPFRVRYNIRGIDTTLAGGLAQGKDGKIYGISFMGSTPEFAEHVGVRACPAPPVVRLTDSGRVTCFPPSESKPPNLSDHKRNLINSPASRPLLSVRRWVSNNKAGVRRRP
jgi:hypothetical protein